MQEGNTFIHHSAISILFYYMILPPTFNQSQRVWCVFFSFFTENRVHSQAFYHINYLNLKRRTTETFLRSSTPTMMVIIRQGLQKIFRCSLGIVRLCLSFFLWLCQFIIMIRLGLKRWSIIIFKVRPAFFRHVTKSHVSCLHGYK